MTAPNFAKKFIFNSRNFFIVYDIISNQNVGSWFVWLKRMATASLFLATETSEVCKLILPVRKMSLPEMNFHSNSISIPNGMKIATNDKHNKIIFWYGYLLVHIETVVKARTPQTISQCYCFVLIADIEFYKCYRDKQFKAIFTL